MVIAFPTRVVFTDGIFLCGARIRIEATQTGIADGLFISGNEFISEYCHFSGFSSVQADGAFTSVRDVTVEGTLAEPSVNVRSTKAALVAASATPATLFTADFSQFLLFNVTTVPIRVVSFSLTVDSGGVVAAVARTPVGGLVTVETASPVVGSVVISVDQSTRRAGA